MTEAQASHTLAEKTAAWAVHAFTLSGLLWATLAVAALIEGKPEWMWLWLGIALVVDGVDGTLARKFRVKEVVSWFNGTVVDHVVDYLTWTAIPVMYMVMHLPLGPKPLALALAVLILVSSMFCYANDLAKSRDNYFVGFPAAWNIVAVLLAVWHAPMAVCIITIVVFCVLTLVPLHYTHPFRVARGRTGNIIATFVWIVSTGVLVVRMTLEPGVFTPTMELATVVINVAAGAWLIVGGIRRSLQGARAGR